MKLFITLISILSFTISLAQNLKPTREAFSLKIPVNVEKVYEEDIKITPYFPRPLLLQIYPSEKLVIEVIVKADTIFLIQVVKENLHPEITVEIEFTQNVKNK
jgi:hypothetical protein